MEHMPGVPDTIGRVVHQTIYHVQTCRAGCGGRG